MNLSQPGRGIVVLLTLVAVMIIVTTSHESQLKQSVSPASDIAISTRGSAIAEALQGESGTAIIVAAMMLVAIREIAASFEVEWRQQAGWRHVYRIVTVNTVAAVIMMSIVIIVRTAAMS